MGSIKRTARIAGLLYLFITVTGAFSIIYVPARLIVRGNATATAEHILANQSLFRINLLNGLVSSVVFLFLALVLYRLLQEVNRQHAALMVILVMVQIPLAFIDALNQIAAFILVRGPDFLSVFDKGQREALAMLFLNLNDQGTVASELFWGLWLFPLGMLVFRSRFLPRVLGVWLILNGFAYLAIFCTGLLVPQYLELVNKIAFPALLGEVAFAFWLVIMGARPKPPAASVPEPAGS